MKETNLLADAITAIKLCDNETAIKRIEQFIYINTPKTKSSGKVSIYGWANDEVGCRPMFDGVFHDAENKVAVASDTHVLIVSKPDYREFADGKSHIIAKAGSEIKGKYVPYQKVIPSDDGRKELIIDRDNIANMLTKARADKKADKDCVYKAFNIGTYDEPLYIDPKYCKLLLTLPIDGKFLVRDSISPIKYVSDDGNYTALFMPMLIISSKDDMVKFD